MLSCLLNSVWYLEDCNGQEAQSGTAGPQRWGIVIHQNIRNCSPNDMASNHWKLWFSATSLWEYYLSWHFLLFGWIFYPEAGRSMSAWNVGAYLPNLYMASSIVPIISRWQYECDLIWFSGGHSTFFGFLNTFVHIFMYTYYLLAALGPQYQQYLWWKKHLTTLQMVSCKSINKMKFLF
jgi:GNS1/SUR4 family.